MKNAEMNQKLVQAMSDFEDAYVRLQSVIGDFEHVTGTDINYVKGFVESYPFDKSFDELAIRQWVEDVAEGLLQAEFKILGYQYLNTGGNTMVGIHEVWLPEEKKVVYVYTNEEGSTISTVDYIRHDLDIDDYDELIMENVDWGRITGCERYFELYRYCYNQYLVDDCKYFGITRGVQYHLLSDRLQKLVTDDYLKHLAADYGMLVETDGKIIVTDPDYEPPAEDEALREIKDWQRWHDDIPADNDLMCEMYNKCYQLTLGDKTVRIPFYAESFEAVESLLNRVIKDW